ncbi:aminoglycoside 6-adenylyltransferase [Paenibacillus caseinilyticus]|uniref:Aminoglycoside 6-adenylyltransferase n=1 Tax=Paenibacillus mucilaginosus K02 TaxID=997761 RepID=I0BR12_9BACL|nr:aminoglycoside 6-adenylyltransferase [Paenibacillus mucilaginosus]AFH64809.1 aminoglycoside 6-adenylyltransferase [Paenibacillus mucilaginosus K02]
MRSEREMMDTILSFANEEEGIRAVIMNGSRVNPKAGRDPFQDYDIVFFVRQVGPFVRDRSWVRRFGGMMIMQTPDEMETEPDASGEYSRFAFLMQFADGNRIDLTLIPYERRDKLPGDSLSVLLLDKDGTLEPYPPPSDRDYLTQPPAPQSFAACCNEFWWVSTYVAKGLWRRELPYAKTMMEGPVRSMLVRMLEWHVGIHSGFTAATGKAGKHLEKHLAPKLWEAYVGTYADGDYDRIWEAMFVMGGLFRETAQDVASHFGYAYPEEDDRRVTAHLHYVRALPEDAEELYGEADG